MTGAQDTVTRYARCRLRIVPGPWRFAADNAAAIRAHWQARRAECPQFFDGTVHVLAGATVTNGEFEGTLRPVAFKSFLYWRDLGFPQAGVRDVFGSALLRSADGRVLLGRQTGGNLNAGMTYLPGGFIDPRDAAADGSVDIVANVRRELEEETGLGTADLACESHVLVTQAGPQVSIAVPLRSPLLAADIEARIRAFLAAEPEAELADVLTVARTADLTGLALPDYARVLLHTLLP